MRQPINERRLIERLQARDSSAVGDLATEYGARIYQLAFRYVRNREDAEEITQDVLLRVYQKIDLFRGDAALSSWIYRITFNAAMSRLRTSKAARAAEVEDKREASDFSLDGAELASRRREVADWSSMADEQVMRAELRDQLMDALRELPAIYRAPVVLRDLRGLSTEEASALLKVKDQTLKSRLHRGRVILRERLSNFAGGLSLHRPLPAH